MWKVRRVAGFAVLAAWMLSACALASAQDLTNWNLEGPVMDGADSTPVLLPNGQIRLYFSPPPSSPLIGIVSAVSSDGRTFVLDPGVRVPFGPAGTGPVVTRVVPLVNGQWRMFFTMDTEPGGNGGIASAIGNDGLNFTIEPGLRIPMNIAGQASGIDGGTYVTLPDGTFRAYFGLQLAGEPLCSYCTPGIGTGSC
jgi:hypothetical protein